MPFVPESEARPSREKAPPATPSTSSDELVITSTPPAVMPRLSRIWSGVLVPEADRARVFIAPLGADRIRLVTVIVFEKLPEVTELICTVLVLSFVIRMECVLAGACARDQFPESSHAPLPALTQLLVCACVRTGNATALRATVVTITSRRTIETSRLIDLTPLSCRTSNRLFTGQPSGMSSSSASSLCQTSHLEPIGNSAMGTIATLYAR